MAHRAAAPLVQGGLVQGILGVEQIAHPLAGEGVAVAGVAGGHHAVEQVHAPPDRLQNIHRRAHAHEIAYLVLGHMGLNGLDDLVHHLRGLAHRQASNAIAVQVHLRDLAHMLHPQVREGAALVDAEQQLLGIQGPLPGVEPGHLRLAALEPPGGPGAGAFGVIIRGGVLHALVKGHGDGGAQVGLDAHTLLRAHKNSAAVDMGGEGHALLPDVPQLGQGEHLEAAAVGEHGAVPAGEGPDAPQSPDRLVTGAQVEVIGIAELDLASQLLQVIGGDRPLDGSGGGHVHKAGGLHRAVDRGKLPPAGGALGFQ